MSKNNREILISQNWWISCFFVFVFLFLPTILSNCDICPLAFVAHIKKVPDIKKTCSHVLLQCKSDYHCNQWNTKSDILPLAWIWGTYRLDFATSRPSKEWRNITVCLLDFTLVFVSSSWMSMKCWLLCEVKWIIYQETEAWYMHVI